MFYFLYFTFSLPFSPHFYYNISFYELANIQVIYK